MDGDCHARSQTTFTIESDDSKEQVFEQLNLLFEEKKNSSEPKNFDSKIKLNKNCLHEDNSKQSVLDLSEQSLSEIPNLLSFTSLVSLDLSWNSLSSLLSPPPSSPSSFSSSSLPLSPLPLLSPCSLNPLPPLLTSPSFSSLPPLSLPPLSLPPLFLPPSSSSLFFAEESWKGEKEEEDKRETIEREKKKEKEREFLLLPRGIEKMILSGNILTSLPSQFSLFQSLHTLRLSRNRLKEYPSVLKEIKTLRSVILIKNEIEALPLLSSFSFPCLLEWLDLSENPIVAFPHQVKEFKKSLPNTYTEISSPDLILPSLYLGSRGCANEKLLNYLGVKFVVSICHHPPPLDPSFQRMILEVNDDEKTDIFSFLPSLCSFINKGRKNSSVLVHCDAGVSRSGAAICAFVMKTLSLSFLDALSFVRGKREFVDPNSGFRAQLSEWERELFQETHGWGRPKEDL